MVIRAGRLRHYVTIEQKTEVRDAVGGNSVAWSVFANTWADIEPVRPLRRQGEVIEAGEFTTSTIAKITLRYVSGMDNTMRINHNGTYYNIRSISNVDVRNRVIELMATYGDAGNAYVT